MSVILFFFFGEWKRRWVTCAINVIVEVSILETCRNIGCANGGPCWNFYNSTQPGRIILFLKFLFFVKSYSIIVQICKVILKTSSKSSIHTAVTLLYRKHIKNTKKNMKMKGKTIIQKLRNWTFKKKCKSAVKWNRTVRYVFHLKSVWMYESKWEQSKIFNKLQQVYIQIKKEFAAEKIL